MENFIKQAAKVHANKNQLRLLRETPFYAFVHFGMNSVTNLELGTGQEDPKIFNPVNLDTDKWCESFLAAGMKGVVLTAKHHDGFCLWQSKYTEHCMKNSPYKNGKGDIVKELADSCAKYGLKFGFYLSPWDRNSRLYGSEEYNQYYKNQLIELLTGYGEIFHVWFDCFCAEGVNGKKQEYDFKGYIDLIKQYQPNATFFNDHGVVRWCGNESGTSKEAEWSVVPSELCYLNTEIQTGPGPLKGDLSYMYNYDKNIGSLSNILYSKGLVYSPSEVDMSIRPGWFYHPNEKPHSLERLFNTYLNSVGGNTTFILNVPPKQDGSLDQEDVARLKELGDLIDKTFKNDLALDAQIEIKPYSKAESQQVIKIKLKHKTKINYLELQEDIAIGQRVEYFVVNYLDENGMMQHIGEGTTIGARKILKIQCQTDLIEVIIVASRDVPIIYKTALY